MPEAASLLPGDQPLQPHQPWRLEKLRHGGGAGEGGPCQVQSIIGGVELLIFHGPALPLSPTILALPALAGVGLAGASPKQEERQVH